MVPAAAAVLVPLLPSFPTADTSSVLAMPDYLRESEQWSTLSSRQFQEGGSAIHDA